METTAKVGRLTRSSLTASCPAVNGGVVVFFAAVVAGALVSASWMSSGARVTSISTLATRNVAQKSAPSPEPEPTLPRLTSPDTNRTPSAPANLASPPRQSPPPASAPEAAATPTPPPPPSCPAYFRWIHEDLRPWRATGITREAVDGAARRHGPKFRVTVVAGRLHVALHGGRCFQTRDVFTQWGILQLLRRYPGRVPDLDLVFDCQDLPVVDAGGGHTPSPMFGYCGSERTVDIAFPDWSFWGWPELNIKPWEALRGEIAEGNAAVKWTGRAPYAYWKGNPTVGADRWNLVRCNASGKRDWNARIYAQVLTLRRAGTRTSVDKGVDCRVLCHIDTQDCTIFQDWRKEVREGFRESDLAKQCTHRYKIYIEGRGWSVSEKYILACESVALIVRPRYHDFFSRGLMPLQHYWPIPGGRGMCRSIKFAVDWGNAHTDKAQEIAGNATKFIQEDLTTARVYDYMFHLLTEYAKLLKYRPTVPDSAVEVTVESILHRRRGRERQFMVDTMVDGSGTGEPCELPPPFSSDELQTLWRRQLDASRQVEMWEKHDRIPMSRLAVPVQRLASRVQRDLIHIAVAFCAAENPEPRGGGKDSVLIAVCTQDDRRQRPPEMAIAVADVRQSMPKLVAVLSRTSAAFLFVSVVVVGLVSSARWITRTTLQASLPGATAIPAAVAATATRRRIPPAAPRPTYSISCSAPPLPTLNLSGGGGGGTPESSQTLALALSSSSSCRRSSPGPPPNATASTNSSSCPSYFRFIHEDLRPWRDAGGVTRAMLGRARATASFRLVVLGGRAFVERFRPAFQTRDLFTIWGVLQLLRRYPGRVPDLDLMFDCADWPVVRTHLYRGKHAAFMPPLFGYCGDDRTLDIVFPDWSFWGWPEINIKPWDALRKDLKDGNSRVRWLNREPYAYWKGNPAVAVTRQELIKCNVSNTKDWNARIYKQDWFRESKAGYKDSNLGSQCIHRSLMPIQHYWPVQNDDKCGSIKYAVDWGNSHKQLAQRIGKQASDFIQEEVNMAHVYDYMLHLLTEYAKLLRFKPIKPPEAVEICLESLACQAEGLEKKFFMESMVKSAHDAGPCDLPPPFNPQELTLLKRRKENSIKQVETWERRSRRA
uniref:Glycosyl transferase CAP10 domain-containing protein n=1 Tax=Leersia perrieri TaxID=77586 RepID=A0A0D9W7J9_9ORYZ